MGNVDGLPIASQAKSVVQASRGDVDGAWATQDRFTRHCIGAAQLRSAIEVVRGDVNAAASTQRAFLANAGRLLERSEVADAVPVLAQIKAAAHAADGRVEEAAVTQRNFLTRCPVVSQVRSLVDLASGKPEEALETQREFLDFSSRSLDQVPLLGQAKAWLHRSLGDEERATLAYEAATASSRRSLELLTSGINDVFGSSTSAGSSSPPVSNQSIYNLTDLVQCVCKTLKTKSLLPRYAAFTYFTHPALISGFRIMAIVQCVEYPPCLAILRDGSCHINC